MNPPTVALDADRRLLRLDPSIGRGAAFFCTVDELAAFVEQRVKQISP